MHDLATRELALMLRDFLISIGRVTPDCMPGGADPCGRDDATHLTGYLICVKAFCDYALRTVPPQVVMTVCEAERRELEAIYGA